jgi:hypothetical protein
MERFKIHIPLVLLQLMVAQVVQEVTEEMVAQEPQTLEVQLLLELQEEQEEPLLVVVLLAKLL